MTAAAKTKIKTQFTYYPEPPTAPKQYTSIAITRTKRGDLPDTVLQLIGNPALTLDVHAHAELLKDTQAMLFSSSTHAYQSLIQARKYGVQINIDGECLSSRSITDSIRFTEKLVKFAPTLADFENQLEQLTEMIISCLSNTAAAPNEIERLAQLVDYMPHASPEDKAVRREKISQRFTQYLQDTKRFHAIELANTQAIFLTMGYDSALLDFMKEVKKKKKKAIFLLTGAMGSGKTQNVLHPAFEFFCENGDYPRFDVCKRSMLASKIDDPRHYQNALHRLQTPKGLYSVINSSFHARFKEFNRRSKVLIIDEIEEVRTHLAGHAIGRGSLAERATLLKQLEAQVCAAELVIASDALASDHTVDWLHAVTGCKIYVVRNEPVVRYEQTVHHYGTINGVKQAISVLTQKLRDGENIALFCDAKKESVCELHSSFKTAIPDLKSILIDGEYASTSEGRELLANADEQLSQYQLTLITPVINSGVSIQTDHFQSVFVFAAGTILPTNVIQSMRRFRRVDNIHFAMFNSVQNRYTNPDVVEMDELTKFTPPEQFHNSLLTETKNNPHAQKIVHRIVFENQMRTNYERRVLLILDQLGFTVKFVKTNLKARKEGISLMDAGSMIESEFRRTHFQNAKVLQFAEVALLKQKEDAITRKEALDIQAYIIRNVLKIEQITLPDIQFYESGGLSLVQRLKLARIDPYRFKKANNTAMALCLRQILQLLNLDPNTWRGEYSNDHARDVMNFVHRGSIDVNDVTIQASYLFGELFGDMPPFRKRPSSYVKVILMRMGLIDERTDKKIRSESGVRNYAHIVHRNECLILAEQYYEKGYADLPATMKADEQELD
nr:hypothetical protein [uncultured Tolumonas sp.]